MLNSNRPVSGPAMDAASAEPLQVPRSSLHTHDLQAPVLQQGLCGSLCCISYRCLSVSFAWPIILWHAAASVGVSSATSNYYLERHLMLCYMLLGSCCSCRRARLRDWVPCDHHYNAKSHASLCKYPLPSACHSCSQPLAAQEQAPTTAAVGPVGPDASHADAEVELDTAPATPEAVADQGTISHPSASEQDVSAGGEDLAQQPSDAKGAHSDTEFVQEEALSTGEHAKAKHTNTCFSWKAMAVAEAIILLHASIVLASEVAIDLSTASCKWPAWISSQMLSAAESSQD